MSNKTLTSVLINLYQNNSENGVYFVNNNNDLFLSYKKLYAKATFILNELIEKGVKQKDELLIQVEENETFIEYFWACILGGIVPVPVSLANNEEGQKKISNIWSILKNPYFLCEKKNLERLKFDERIHKNQIIISDNFDEKNELKIINRKNIYMAQENDIAFIQFSSGSTGTPKGVTLTHKNLLTNLQAICKGSNTDFNDISLSWMPLTHDMGLIGFHLFPLFMNITQLLIPTSLFIKRPLLWLEKVSEYEVTFTASPNFGYAYYLKAYNKSKSINLVLSKLRLIYNGAEPISAELCNSFLDTMEKHGLKKESIFTVYGMAEASLAVSFPKAGEKFQEITFDRNFLNIGQAIKIVNKDNIHAVSFVKLGKEVENCRIGIFDENSKELPNGHIGEIKIKGKNVTESYYNDSVKTAELINNQWLNTGDLGVFFNDELVVTGRKKDIIFINGQNFYAHDIERILIDEGEVDYGKIAVCSYNSIQKFEEDIIIFILYKSDNLEIFSKTSEKIKQIISLKTGLYIKYVIPVKNMPKTTSGKIQRFLLKEKFINNEYAETLKNINSILSSNESSHYEFEKELAILLKEILEHENIDNEKSFFELGGNSLLAVEFIEKINAKFQTELEIVNLYEHSSIKKLCCYIKNKGNAYISNSVNYKENLLKRKRNLSYKSTNNI